VQFVLASCQLYVFGIESGPDACAYPGGLNTEIHYEDDVADSYLPEKNPVPDFISFTKLAAVHARDVT